MHHAVPMSTVVSTANFCHTSSLFEPTLLSHCNWMEPLTQTSSLEQAVQLQDSGLWITNNFQFAEPRSVNYPLQTAEPLIDPDVFFAEYAATLAGI